MFRRITTLDDAPLDIIEAVRRAFVQRGIILIPRRNRRKKPLIKDAQKGGSSAKIQTKAKSQEASTDSKEPEPGEIHEKLIDITEKAHDTLFNAETVFPLTPFPHTITLDREKLTIANRSFFRVAKILTVPVSSMISAEVNVGPFFGSVKMTSKYFVDNTHSVNYLWRKDATNIHRLLQGFIIAQEKNIDVSEIDKEDLKTLLLDLGQGVKD